MRIGRVVAVASLALAGSVVLAGPAEAKGPKTVTLSGPGLEEPIVVATYGDRALEAPADDRFPEYLDFALTEAARTSLYDLTNARPFPPRGELGPKYTLTWLMHSPPDVDPEDWTIVQEIYPETPSGPMIHTLASQFTNQDDGWFDAPDVLRPTLAAYTAPEPIAERRPPEQTSSSSSSPPLPAAVAGVTVAFAAGAVLGRRRRRAT